MGGMRRDALALATPECQFMRSGYEKRPLQEAKEFYFFWLIVPKIGSAVVDLKALFYFFPWNVLPECSDPVPKWQGGAAICAGRISKARRTSRRGERGARVFRGR